jgi:hypothetical protein
LVEIPVILAGAPLIMHVTRSSDGYIVASGMMGVITLAIWVPVIAVVNAVRVYNFCQSIGH